MKCASLLPELILLQLLTLCSLLLAPCSLHAQGPLTPPGAPAPTFKTLQQVEPRTPISAIPTNLATASSYYLTTNSGGYAKLRSLAGYAPFTVGIATENLLNGPVQTAFNRLGARINVVHDSAVNLTNRTVHGMYEKPEQADLRLFETNYDGVAPGVILSNAFQWARSSNGVAPPYFVGVKMHDNDFFASNSAWVTIYQEGRRVPPWTNAYSLKSPLISTNEMTNLWNRYEQMVRYAGTNQLRYTALNARGILSRLSVGPQWPLLSLARLAEGAPVSAVAGQFSTVTNRYTAVTNSTWRFVSGPGDCNNGEFTISNGVLRAAAITTAGQPGD